MIRVRTHILLFARVRLLEQRIEILRKMREDARCEEVVHCIRIAPRVFLFLWRESRVEVRIIENVQYEAFDLPQPCTEVHAEHVVYTFHLSSANMYERERENRWHEKTHANGKFRRE